MNKNLLKSMLVAAGMTASMGAWAQTDVTSQYLTNADFSQGTPITVGVCTYAKDMENNGTEYSQLVPVVGWDIPANGDARAGGLVAFGSGVWIGGPGYVAPVTNSDGESTGNILGLVAVWTGTAQYTQDATLPAGTYTLVLGVYNSIGGTQAFSKNLIGFIENGGTEHLATSTTYAVNTWKYEFITFTLSDETAGKFSLGYTSANAGSGNMPHLFLSGIQLFNGEIDAEAYQTAKLAKLAYLESKSLLEDVTYANVTGQERTDLQTAMEAYETNGSTSIIEALEAFKAAKASYDALVAANAYLVDLPYADATKKPAAATATNATDAATKADALMVALRAYYESNAKAEGVEGAVDKSDAIANSDATDGNNSWTWTGNKNEPRNTESWTDSEGKNDYMYFDGGNWGGTGWTTTMEQTITVPAGKYLLTAKGRASDEVTLTLSVGEESVNLPNQGSTGNVFDRGWNDGSVEFTNAEGGDVTILVRATTEGNHQWFSVGDFRLVQLEAITVPMADATDYAALATAITTAEANTLGFDAAEYAPYNNVEALEALAAAKKINPEAEDGNTKSVVEEATAALNAAVWTANTEELNAIYDGQFANTEANATSGDINLPGWTKVQGIRLLVKNVATYPGLTYTEGKAAVFAWGGTTLTYGEQAGYTLPLDTDKPYLLKIKVTGWSDGDYANVFSVTLGDAETQTVDPQIPGRINDAEGNPFVDLKFAFKVTEAQPVLKIYANHHFAIADLELMTTDEATYDVVTGLTTVSTAAANSAAIYNLAGQQVKSTQKGLYIQNGRKYIVK